MDWPGGFRPVFGEFSGNLPFFQRLFLVTGHGQLLAERFELLFVPLLDDVYLGIVRDGFQRDVGYPLIDKPIPNVAMGWR